MSEMPNSAPNDAMPSVMTVVTDLIEGQRETHLLVTQANVSTQYRITKLARIIEKQLGSLADYLYAQAAEETSACAEMEDLETIRARLANLAPDPVPTAERQERIKLTDADPDNDKPVTLKRSDGKVFELHTLNDLLGAISDNTYFCFGSRTAWIFLGTKAEFERMETDLDNYCRFVHAHTVLPKSLEYVPLRERRIKRAFIRAQVTGEPRMIAVNIAGSEVGLCWTLNDIQTRLIPTMNVYKKRYNMGTGGLDDLLPENIESMEEDESDQTKAAPKAPAKKKAAPKSISTKKKKPIKYKTKSSKKE